MAYFSRETKAEIEQVAKAKGIEPTALLAICEVESAGRAFAIVDNRREPLIRFEGHYFDRLLPETARAKARSMGLASPRAGMIKNPRSQSGRWTLLKRARSIDDDAALQSCSWGIGQVMGAHWKALGFSSPQALVREARSGVGGQVLLMVRFIEENGLMRYLRARDWAGFARRYNGPAYRKNRYDEKMAAAYKRYRSGSHTRPTTPRSNNLRRGMRGARVKDLQRQLLAAGYPIACDGVFGPKTEVAVKSFQRTKAILVDGVVGPQTRNALNDHFSTDAQEPHWIARWIEIASKMLPAIQLATRLWRWTR